MPYAVFIIAITAIGYFYCAWNRKEKKKLAWHAKHGGLYYRYLVVGFIFSVLGYLLYAFFYWAGKGQGFRESSLYAFIEPFSQAVGSQMSSTSWSPPGCLACSSLVLFSLLKTVD